MLKRETDSRHFLQ